MMKHVIGIDLGATTIKCGVVENERLTKQLIQDTKADTGGSTTLNVLKDSIKSLKSPYTEAIGIGVPSVVDSVRGIVYNVQNIKGWEEVHLKTILEQEFGIPVFINNDANCFAMGERIYGTGKRFDHFVGITLGTGVGGGIIQQGRLLADANCGSGEYGEMPYLDGILEHYCGSFFFTHNQTSGREVALLAKQGDSKAIRLMNEYGSHIAVLVKMIVLSVDPQAIIFGGAIAGSFSLFETSMREHLEDFPFAHSMKKLQILKSELQDIGILGAAALCY